MRSLIALIGLSAILVTGCNSGPSDDQAAKPKPSSPGTSGGPKNQTSESAGTDLIDPPPDLVARSGISNYPGAKVMRSMQSVQGNSEDDFLDVVYFTPDPAKKVFDFYKKELVGPQVVGTDSLKSGVYCLDGKNSVGESMRIQAQTQGGRTTVHVIRRTKK